MSLIRPALRTLLPTPRAPIITISRRLAMVISVAMVRMKPMADAAFPQFAANHVVNRCHWWSPQVVKRLHVFSIADGSGGELGSAGLGGSGISYSNLMRVF